MPEPFRLLQAKMLRQPSGDREMVDILSLVLHHDEQAVLCAVELALEAGNWPITAELCFAHHSEAQSETWELWTDEVLHRVRARMRPCWRGLRAEVKGRVGAALHAGR